MAKIFWLELFTSLLLMCESANTVDGAVQNLDGWSLLQNETELQQTYRNYDPTHNTTTCPKAATVVRDEDRHQVTEELEYLNRTSGTWMSFKSTFQFYMESTEYYNFMNTTEGSGGPPAACRFLYVDNNCTVMKLVFVNYAASALQSLGTGNNSALCGIWVQPEAIGSESTSCKATFYAKCDTTRVQSVYSEAECKHQAQG